MEDKIRGYILQLMGSKYGWIKACGARLSMLKLVISDRFDTMATDGVTLYVNPVWPDTRGDFANLFTLIHEGLHVWFRHSERLRDFPGPREIIHKAADFAINLLAVQQGCPYPMPNDGLYDEKYVDDKGRALSAELIAHLLMQDMQDNSNPNPEPGDSDGNGNSSNPQDSAGNSDSGSDADDADGESDADGSPDESGDAGSAGSDADQDSDVGQGSGSGQESGQEPATGHNCGELLPAPDDLDTHKAAQQAIAAATLAEKMAGKGSLPDWLQQCVEDTVKQSKTSWLQQLHDRFATFYAERDYSYEKFHQAYAMIGMVEPTLYSEGIGKVAIVGDESGSMSDDELNMVNSQTAELLQQWEPSEVLIIRHDSEIVYTESLQAGEQPTPRTKRSYGGTDFRPVLDMCREQNVDVIVWVTDCMPNDRPVDNGIPTVFLGTAYGSEHWHSRYLWGDFIDIQEE